MNQPIVISVPECGHVQYIQHRNKWAAVREGATVAEKDSLNDAEQFLRDLVKRENAKDSPFKRHDAFVVEYRWNDPKRVTVTSYASDREAWVRDAAGRRSKVSFEQLRVCSPANEAAVAEIDALGKQEEELSAQRRKIGETLSPYKKVAS